MAEQASADRDVCLWCNTSIYRNTVDRWLHLATGSVFCPSINVATPTPRTPSAGVQEQE